MITSDYSGLIIALCFANSTPAQPYVARTESNLFPDGSLQGLLHQDNVQDLRNTTKLQLLDQL